MAIFLSADPSLVMLETMEAVEEGITGEKMLESSFSGSEMSTGKEIRFEGTSWTTSSASSSLDARRVFRNSLQLETVSLFLTGWMKYVIFFVTFGLNG